MVIMKEEENLMIRRRLSERALRQPPRRDWLVAAVFGVCVSPVDELILRQHHLWVGRYLHRLHAVERTKSDVRGSWRFAEKVIA